jgi:N6-L-threonylcarbamoyladenine synthase
MATTKETRHEATTLARRGHLGEDERRPHPHRADGAEDGLISGTNKVGRAHSARPIPPYLEPQSKRWGKIIFMELKKKITILAIETSCDETGLAVLEARGGKENPQFTILGSVLSSQIEIHRPFGGVVPNLAKREHIKNLPILLRELEEKVPKLFQKIDTIAVTVGPGLEPALWAGITFAQALAKQYKLPLIGANHLEGHLYSFLLPQKGKKKISQKNIFPAIALLVSGGHTILFKMESLTKLKKIGETRDDAVGEAFDKVARLLELPYPGGPEIEKLAKEGKGDAIAFPRPMIHDKNYDFSFSGLKTSVFYYMRETKNPMKADIAASFEEAALEVLLKKTMRAAEEFGAQSILLSGGVAANKPLREKLAKESKKRKLNFFVPDFAHNTDNAVMIATGAYISLLRKKRYPLRANGGLHI